MEFHLRRNIGYFVLQLYVPCGLIVSCSWVNFWIDPDAVPARVQLGNTAMTLFIAFLHFHRPLFLLCFRLFSFLSFCTFLLFYPSVLAMYFFLFLLFYLFFVLMFPCMADKVFNNCPTRCSTKQPIYYSARSLYMFRVLSTPIIRSTENCNYSIRYWSYVCAVTSF